MDKEKYDWLMIKTSIPRNRIEGVITPLEDLFWLLSPSCVIGVEVNLHHLQLPPSPTILETLYLDSARTKFTSFCVEV